MEQLISQMIEIENRAQYIISEPLRLREKLDDIINEETQIIRTSYFKRANERILKIEQNERKFMTGTVNELEKNRTEQIRRMDELVKNNEDIWVDELFSKITGR